MLYEFRTYTLKPGSIAEFEKRFEAALPGPRETFGTGSVLAHGDRAVESGHSRLAV